jgi:hypothetical protein
MPIPWMDIGSSRRELSAVWEMFCSFLKGAWLVLSRPGRNKRLAICNEDIVYPDLLRDDTIVLSS